MKKYTGYFVAVPILIGSLTLIGWVLSISFFKCPFSVSVAMNPMTALCFILSGTAFLLDYKKKAVRWLSVLSATIAITVALIGALKLLKSFGLDLHVDSWLFHRQIIDENAHGHINRMAPNTALCFVLIGLSLRFALLGSRRAKAIFSYMALATFVIGLFAFIGNLYQVKEYYGILQYMPMAELTAVSFIFLSLAFLFENNDKDFMQVISSRYTGGKIARLLIPVVIIIPILFGYIRLYLSWVEPITVELGAAALVTSIIIIFFSVVWILARELNASDASRREIEQLYQKMVQEVQDYAILSLDINGNILNWNKGAEKIKGYRSDEVLGKNFRIFSPKEAQAQMLPEQLLKEAVKKGRAEDEGWRVRKDGTRFWASVTLTALHDERDNVIGFSKMTRDLNERKSAEMEMLHQAELFNILPDGVIYGKRDLTITSMNQAAENLFEVSAAELVGRKMNDLISNDMTDNTRREAGRELWEGKGIWKGETTFTTKSGKKVAVKVTLKAVNDDTGSSWFGIYTDITRSKETQLRLEFALDSMEAGLWEWNMVSDTRWWSPRYFDVLGYDNKELHPSAEVLQQLIHPDDADMVFQTIKAYTNEREGFEIENRFKMKNGEYHWFRVIGKTKFDEAGKPLRMAGSIVDIDEKKKAQQVIEQQALLIQTIPDGVIYGDMNFHIISLNKGAEEMFGVSSEEARGKTVRDIVSVSLIGRSLDAARSEFAEKGFLRQEMEMTNKAGRKMTLFATARQYSNLKGMEPGWVSIYTDISPLRLNEELKTANNYLEQLAFISAHDIKSPIHTLGGLADMLSRSQNIKQEDKDILQMQQDVIEQMRQTNQALNDILKLRKGLMSGEMLYRDSLTLSAIMDNIKATLRSDIESSGALLEIDLHDTGGLKFPVFYLQSVFHNLLLNAIKYRSPDRTPLIRFEAKKTAADTITFTISDNGSGFDMERNKDKLFGIFKRFHADVQGSGVGLHIVKSIIDAYGGEITVDSIPGRGTTFEITLKTTILV